MIVIVDYKMGNVGSILNMLKKLSVEAVISDKPEVINKASKLILPGVGAFDTGMNSLNNLSLVGCLNKKVLVQKTPILGICVGMQLMAKSSEEGEEQGLGWFDGTVNKFSFGPTEKNLKVPCMGWNTITCERSNPLFDSSEEERFYFVHSYHYSTENQNNVIATATYGYKYPAAICKDNIYGVQFHPEKSHKFGLKLFKKFLELC